HCFAIMPPTSAHSRPRRHPMPTSEQIEKAAEAIENVVGDYFAIDARVSQMIRVAAREVLSAAALTAAEGVKPRVKPLDLSNLLKHAFSAGYLAAAGDSGWTDYDPTVCAAYARVL